MFCKNCGQEIDDKAVVCIHCGCATDNKIQTSSSDKSWIVALLLCLFLGGFGAHRFYVGKNGTAVTMLLFTLLLGWIGIGLLVSGLWALIDFIMICCNNFETADGKKLAK